VSGVDLSDLDPTDGNLSDANLRGAKLKGASSISSLSRVTHSQDYDLTAVIPVDHDIAAAFERHHPLAELGRHLVDVSAEFRVSAQDSDALASRSDCASRSFVVFRREESTAREIRQCRRCPDDGCHRSGVRGRRLYFVGFQPREPRVSFVSRDVQASCLILSPRLKCIVPQSLTTFLALDVLFYGFPHERIRRTSL
jgi:hypothetical protein